jgi:hypothetical protein
MDTSVTILRELWRRRVAVGLIALQAIALGMLLAYKPSLPPVSRAYKVGTATAHILVDTPDSQVVEVAPKGSETLGQRAGLLSNLMAEGEVEAAIARRAGLRSNELLAVAHAGIDPQSVTPKQKQGPNVNLLTTSVLTNDSGEQLPIIEVTAQAPDAERAARLANAAVAGLGDYLDSKAAVERVSDARRLRVRGLGAAGAREALRGPSQVVALAAAIFIFVFECALLLVISALARGWRAASEQDDLAVIDEDRPAKDSPFEDSAVTVEPAASGVEPLRLRHAERTARSS